MSMYRLAAGSALILCLGTASPDAFAAPHFNDFQAGDTEGWTVGNIHPNPPVVVFDDGPLGFGDHFLQLTAVGSPASPNAPGSRLLSFNGTEWNGDYLAAGFTAISVDMINFANVDLSMRVALNGPGGYFVSTLPITLPAGLPWATYSFPITALDLTPEAGSTDPLLTLGAVSELRILHNPDPRFFGSVIDAQIGLDNIQAIVPIPAALPAGLGLLGGLWLRRRGRGR